MNDGRSWLFGLSLTALRFLMCAWIGAAVLYVITSVAEQTSPDFGSLERDQLATIRFPLYYQFGFAIHLAALGLAPLAWATSPANARKRMLVVMVMVVLSLLGMTLDFVYVYQPLQELIVPPGQARTTDFIQLHTWSRHANEAHLTLAMIAAVVASLPLKASGTNNNVPASVDS